LKAQMTKTLKLRITAKAFLCFLCLFVATQVMAQETSIAGRVVASGGNFPIVNARVFARMAGGPTSMRVATTDDDGKFQLTNLSPGNYVIRVGAAGYIPEPSLAASPFYRPGENVTIRMIKGGVITGRVLNKNGEPMALARVRSVRVKDEEGNSVRDATTGRDWTTDDRGMYRLYGLESGAYVVSATFTNAFRAASSQSRTGSEAAPTYYPSATLDGATLVNVNAGNETGGIDIRYRAERSYAVRGTIAGQNAQSGAQVSRTAISVTLSHAGTGVVVAGTAIVPLNGNNVFNFEGVADGAYELTAQTGSGTSDAATALPQRVNVQGASVTGLVLTLTPMGSIAGRVLLEATEPIEACRGANAGSIQETLVTARREVVSKKAPSPLPVEGKPDQGGEFLLTNLNAGRYVLDVRPPSRIWFVRDIAWDNAAKTPSSDVMLKLGERVQGLKIKLAQGAGSIAGQVSSGNADGRLRVYVVPAEKEHENNALRYADTPLQADGAFSITNIAPGRYWLLVREVDPSMTRATLRREAVKANVEMELQPCQKLVNQALRITQ
jgi:5-hydroxyisourate hydrolase-like protein (transthyretin family)